MSSEIEEALAVVVPIIQAIGKNVNFDLEVKFAIKSKPSVDEIKVQAEVAAQQMNSFLYVKTLEKAMTDPDTLAALRGAGIRTNTEKPAGSDQPAA